MKHFEAMLLPYGQRLLHLHLSAQCDITPHTTIEFLDDQTVLRTDVIYLGTPKMATAILKGQVSLEPACFILLGGCSAPVLDHLDELGNISCAEVNCSLTRLYNQVSRYILTNLQQSNDNYAIHSFASVWEAILKRDLITSEAIKTAITSFCPGLKEFIRVGVIAFDQTASDEEYDSLQTELLRLLDDAFIQRYNDQLVFIYSHNDRTLQLPFSSELLEQMEAVLEEHHASISVSHGLRSFDKLRTTYLMCERVHVLARALRLPDVRRVYSYDRFSMYYVTDLATQQFVSNNSHSDIIYLIHPAVIMLTRYDTKHHTNLRDTLFYYLINDRNLQRTAAATFTHRNTVINRINKITELTGLSFDNGGLIQRLLFSCQLIQYYERVLKLTLRL